MLCRNFVLVQIVEVDVRGKEYVTLWSDLCFKLSM